MKSLLLTIALASAPLWADSGQCPFQNAILNGAYAVTLSGTAGSPVWNGNTGPVATVAKFVFDGLGNIQLPSITIVGANPPLNVSPPFTITGSYTVNPDCTGNLTLNFSPNPNRFPRKAPTRTSLNCNPGFRRSGLKASPPVPQPNLRPDRLVSNFLI